MALLYPLKATRLLFRRPSRRSRLPDIPSRTIPFHSRRCVLVLPARTALLQEVLELGDGASTDSGWGGSASSSAEEKSSGRERDGDDDDERSTSSGGGSVGSGDASPVISGSELAVFLFQGGVKGSFSGETGGAMEAQDGVDPSTAVARGQASPSHCLPPSSEDAFFEYSGSGCESASRKALGDLRAGETGSSSAADKANTRESGDTAATSGEAAAAIDVVDCAGRREAVVDRGTKSSSLTGGLRGVDFVDARVKTSPKGAANEPTPCFL